jgi:hypothetical protein
MELIDFKSSCKDCCNSKTKIEACASGKPIIIFLDESAETPTVKYFSLLTGELTTTAPAHLTIGNCNDLLCCGSTEEVIQGEESPAVGDAAPTGSKLFFDTVTQKITRANVDGVWVEIADSSLSFSDILTEGNKILTITDSDGVETEVFESVTEVTAITDGFSYKNEAGEDKDITFEINDTDPLNTKVEVKLNGTTVAEFPLYTVDNDIQINNAGSEWSLTDDQITIVETNGDTQVLNFPYRVTVVANPDGTIDIKQNGVTVGTVPAPFKNQNEFHTDPNGNDTTGDGSQENPYKTITKALSVAGQGDQVIVHAGVYAENITMSTPNVSLVGAQSDYFSLTQIQGTVTVSATGTSVRISDVLVNGAITHSGAADLYLNNVAITSTLTSSSAGYLEVRNSSIQDDTITKSAGTMLIENSKIEDVSITGANTAVVVRDAYQEGGSTITFGAGTVYGINNVQGGEIVINGAAIPLETAALAQGLSAEMAKEAETADFQKLGMLRPDLEASPTKVVTWDEVTGRLEVSDLSAIASAPSVTFGTATPPTGGTPKEGDEYFVTSDGTKDGDVTEQWIYDATTSSWVQRPSSVSYKTTSLTPVYGTGTAYVGASNTALATVADQMRLSDGSIVDDVDVTWVGHPYSSNIHQWFYLDSVTGGITFTKPTSGFIQQLGFVKSLDVIHIDIEQAAEVQSATAGATVTYGTAAPTGTPATGSEYFITSTGTNAGTITSSYIFDGVNWILRPNPISPAWTTSTTDPALTGNVAPLPRFVENTTNGSKWYIDSTGTAKLIEGAADGCGTVFFNALTPTTATIFDDANPPVTDDSTLKNLDCAVYISAVDGSIWSSDGTTYKTKVYSYPLHQREVQTATASQTLFTLTKNPIGGTEQVHVSRNGVDISRAFTWAGNVGTYNPVNNYGCTFDANDTLQFHFEAL